MTTTNTAAPPLPAHCEALMRPLKMPPASSPTPELIAIASTQRWEPAEVIKALFTEDAAGRARSMLASRRKAAGLPTGKTSDSWYRAHSQSRPRPSKRYGPWNGSPARKPRGRDLPGPGKPSSSKRRSTVRRSRDARAWCRLEVLGVVIRAHRTDDSVTRAVARILRAELVVIDDIGLLPVATDAAEGLYRVVDAAYEQRSVDIGSNLHPAGFNELMPKPSPPPPLTNCCTTPTSARPAAIPSASPKPSPEKEAPD